MRRLLLALPLLLAGCAGWSPTVGDANAAARTIACTVCSATSAGPVDQAEAYAEALRVLGEAVARLAQAEASGEAVEPIRAAMVKHQAELRALFEQLVRMASPPAP